MVPGHRIEGHTGQGRLKDTVSVLGHPRNDDATPDPPTSIVTVLDPLVEEDQDHFQGDNRGHPKGHLFHSVDVLVPSHQIASVGKLHDPLKTGIDRVLLTEVAIGLKLMGPRSLLQIQTNQDQKIVINLETNTELKIDTKQMRRPPKNLLKKQMLNHKNSQRDSANLQKHLRLQLTQIERSP